MSKLKGKERTLNFAKIFNTMKSKIVSIMGCCCAAESIVVDRSLVRDNIIALKQPVHVLPGVIHFVWVLEKYCFDLPVPQIHG